MMQGERRPSARSRWLLLPCLLAAACTQVEGPNVILITLDTTRADRLGVMGDADAKTPALDALAGRGVLFARAYASVPLTLPSHTTMLTGLDVHHHGIHDNGRFTLPASIDTVAERLAARGYDTAAFVSAFVLDAEFGLDQGFAVYDSDTDPVPDPLMFSVPTRRGAEVTTRALAWLETPRRTPFFLWAHYYDVHAPRRPPAPFDAVGDPYAGELAYVDAQVARLLAGAQEAASGRETLIIVIGDHGESLGEHDEPTHGILVYDSTLHVPLIVTGPGFPPGQRSETAVGTVDVTPTILAAVGADADDASDGHPLQERLAAPAQNPGSVDTNATDLDYFECFGPEYSMGWARLAGVRSGRWKYTAVPAPPELYDVVADPAERENRIDDEPTVAARLAERYAKLSVAERPPGGSPAAVSLAAQEKLAALGYLVAAEPEANAERPDPRGVVGAFAWIEGSRALALEGEVEAALEALEIFATSPVVERLALRSLAPLYALVGRPEAAVGAFERLAALSGTLDSRVDLAGALVRAARAEDALAVLDTIAADTAEPSARLLVTRAHTLLALGREAEAERDADAALARSPGNDMTLALLSRIRAARHGAKAEITRLQTLLAETPSAERLLETRMVLASLLHEAGRDTEAVALLQVGTDVPAEQRAALAEIAAARGNAERALELYESVLEERPATQRYRLALADLYGALGRHDEALALYDAILALDPEDAMLHIDRGTSRFASGKLPTAEEDYRRALMLDPSLPEASFNLALVQLATGREAQAEVHLLRAVELRSDYAKAHFHLARLYTERKDPRAAVHAERAAQASSGHVTP